MENMDFTVKMISQDGLDTISYDFNFYIEDGILYHGAEELARDIEDDILYATQKIIEFCSDTVLEITDQDDEIVYKDDEFEDVLDESKITDINFKKLNEKLKKFVESILPEIQKMDKICDLDKHYIESGRYIGRRNGKWNIYKYARTSQKFNGDWNYDYKATSPDFNNYDEAIEWFANDLLKYNSEEDLYDCIKEGSFVIYDDKLNAQLGTIGIKAGKLDTTPRFPTGKNKGIDPVPQYMLEPNKAKANNLRRDYIKTHGKPYESVTESVNRILQEEQSYQLYVENLTQPIEVIGNIDKYGEGECQYKGGLELGDTIAVRMLGIRNTDVYNFKITEINEDNLIAIHPRTGTEYNISLSKPVKVSYAKELRFKSVKDDASWFAFLDLDRKTKTELLTNKTGDLS